MSRQAETGMTQPCSKDGGRREETENARREGGRVGRVEIHRAHGDRKKERLREKEREGGGESKQEKKERAAGEMIMIGATNGKFIYTHTVQRTSPEA